MLSVDISTYLDFWVINSLSWTMMIFCVGMRFLNGSSKWHQYGLEASHPFFLFSTPSQVLSKKRGQEFCSGGVGKKDKKSRKGWLIATAESISFGFLTPKLVVFHY